MRIVFTFGNITHARLAVDKLGVHSVLVSYHFLRNTGGAGLSNILTRVKAVGTGRRFLAKKKPSVRRKLLHRKARKE